MRKLQCVIMILILISSAAYAQTVPKAPVRSTPVTAAKVIDGVTLPTIDITGSAYFTDSSYVSSESAGKVSNIFINEGDTVELGQVIATLDDELISYSINSSSAKKAQALLTLEKTKRDFERNESLFKQSAISEQKYQDSKTEYKSAENAYASLTADEGKLIAERAKMSIRSPLKGVVVAKDVNVGEWVSAGGKIADIAALDYEARVYLPEKVLPFVKTGLVISVLTANKEYKGAILSINSKADPATRTFQARISLGADNALKEGVLATARVPSGISVKALFVPRDAIVERNLEKGVFKIIDDSVRFIPVKIIGYSGGDTAISGDLLVGDMVVMKGNDKVNNGSKVTIPAAKAE